MHLTFNRLRNFPSILTLLNVFIMKECWSLSNVFSESIDMSFINYFDMMYLHQLISDVRSVIHYKDKETLVMVYELFHMLMDSFTGILLRIFASILMRETSL